jgi:hypothetical protein
LFCPFFCHFDAPQNPVLKHLPISLVTKFQNHTKQQTDLAEYWLRAVRDMAFGLVLTVTCCDDGAVKVKMSLKTYAGAEVQLHHS